MLTRSNKFVLGRDIPSVGDFILKYSENFDYIKVRKGAPRLVASLVSHNYVFAAYLRLLSTSYHIEYHNGFASHSNVFASH